jgi:hypothetical protein
LVQARKEVTMRVLHAAGLTAAALVLASVASAQGLGDVAAKEKQKRKAEPAKPAKVYTESDIGPSMTPVSGAQDVPATSDQAAAEGQAPAAGQPAAEGQAEGQPPAEGAAPEGSAAAKLKEQEQAQEEARAKAEADWRKRLDQARKEEAVYKDVIDKVQLELNDISGGLYNPGRASKIAFQEENKQKLAEVQGRIAALEEEGRRNRYR